MAEDKGIDLIIGMGKKSKGEKPMPEEEEESDDGYAIIARKVLDAVSEDNEVLLAKVLKDFVKKCGYDSDD